MNSATLVDGIIGHLTGVDDPDVCLQLEVLKEIHTQNTIMKRWEPHEKLPSLSVRTLLSRFLDITTPPSRQLLSILSPFCEDKADEDRISLLANDPSAYEEWRHSKSPHLLETLEEFPSCQVPAVMLLISLMPLQPRFYSISSSVKVHVDEVHLTVAIVKYRTQDGTGPEHYGVCSNYLNNLQAQDEVVFFIRSAANFHMPKTPERPVILIGPGTGIAPFRSFWEEWQYQQELGQKIPKIWLFFGCRSMSLNLYAGEKDNLVQSHVLDKVFLALSREPNVKKTYVQDLLLDAAADVYEMIVEEQGFVYVCGDVTMAENVYETLRYEMKSEVGNSFSSNFKFIWEIELGDALKTCFNFKSQF